MAKRPAEYPHPNYPPHVSYRSGCKVSWLTYDKHEDAEVASKAAATEGDYLAQHGYDYGYCNPGTITTLKSGQFEVCIP